MGCAYQNEKHKLISHFLESISTSMCVYHVHSNVHYIKEKKKPSTNPPTTYWKQPTKKNTLFINSEIDKLQFTYTMRFYTGVTILCC